MFEQEQISNQELTPTGREQAEETEISFRFLFSLFAPVEAMALGTFI